MKKLFVVMILMSSGCYAGDWQTAYEKEKQDAALFIDKLPEYSCFTQVYEVKAELPWEIGGRKDDKAHMLIRKTSTGFLFAQPVPDCEKRNSCGYWIRSTTYSGNVWTHGLERVPCPPPLTKEKMLKLIKSEYSDEYTLDYKKGSN